MAIQMLKDFQEHFPHDVFPDDHEAGGHHEGDIEHLEVKLDQAFVCKDCGWEGPKDELATRYVGHSFGDDVDKVMVCHLCGSFDLHEIE
jgi:hypothetical protein